MPIIRPYKHHHPQIADSAFIAENATIIGEVEIGEMSSIWFNAVLRGDVGKIKIGGHTNIQDGALLHCSSGRTPTVVGNHVVIGHHAILHGCTVEDEALVGMGAIVLDEAFVPTHTIVAAGALVPERTRLESGFLYAGIPAKKIKPLSDSQIAMIKMGAAHYVAHIGEYKEQKNR